LSLRARRVRPHRASGASCATLCLRPRRCDSVTRCTDCNSDSVLVGGTACSHSSVSLFSVQALGGHRGNSIEHQERLKMLKRQGQLALLSPGKLHRRPVWLSTARVWLLAKFGLACR
jgi:hypothetical protein